MFEFESVEFTTQSVMQKEKKRLIEELCEFLEVDRSQFRLQRNNVTLYGKTESGAWFPLTSSIGEFAERIRAKGYVSYKLKTKLKFKIKGKEK